MIALAQKPVRPPVPSRVLRPAYHAGTRCPACGGRAWLIGRRSAECARCGEALPFAGDAR